MVFAGIVGTDAGVRPFGYVTSVAVTIALWLTVAPAIGAVVRSSGKNKDKAAEAVVGSATARGEETRPSPVLRDPAGHGIKTGRGGERDGTDRG
jgi:hypothetical protein